MSRSRSRVINLPAPYFSWLPKITNGWFFRAESFFAVARYLDAAGGAAGPDFLSHSHGEGFLRFFEGRCQRQGIFIFDEPEAALSPSRQIEFLRLLRRMEQVESPATPPPRRASASRPRAGRAPASGTLPYSSSPP